MIIHNAGVIARIKEDFPVIVSGNKSAEDEIEDLFQDIPKKVMRCENMTTEFNVLNIEPSRNINQTLFFLLAQ